MTNIVSNIASSPITSTSGIIGVMGGIVKIIAALHPASLSLAVIANLNEIGNAFITIGIGAIGLFARDNNVTSQQLGLENNKENQN